VRHQPIEPLVFIKIPFNKPPRFLKPWRFKADLLTTRCPALRIAAVILFERYEQKDKSGKPDPAFSRGNAQIKKQNNSWLKESISTIGKEKRIMNEYSGIRYYNILLNLLNCVSLPALNLGTAKF
jgi:hypothetical protein